MGMDLLSSIEIIVCLVRASLLEGRPGTRRSRLLVLVMFLPEEDPRLCTCGRAMVFECWCSRVGVRIFKSTYTDKMKSIADEHSLHSLIQRRV